MTSHAHKRLGMTVGERVVIVFLSVDCVQESMVSKIGRFWEGYITALSDAKYSYSAIISACKKRGFGVSKKGISSVLNNTGKSSNGAIPKGKKQADPRPSSTSRTPEVIRKVKKIRDRK